MGKIYKHIYTVVVLSESDEAVDDLNVLADSIDTGEDIGQFEHTSTEEVPAEQVKSELLAIGNDGTFFESLEDDWVDSHSVNCYFCNNVVDERECVPADPFNDNDGGDICQACLKEKGDS